MQILVIWRNRRQFASVLGGVFRRRPVDELLVVDKVLSKSSYSHNEFKMIVQHSLFLTYIKPLNKLKSFGKGVMCLYRKIYQIDATKMWLYKIFLLLATIFFWVFVLFRVAKTKSMKCLCYTEFFCKSDKKWLFMYNY